ncbi:hypothetical protein AMTR_s00001p00272340 [Amborella trichopoda]|uniref:AB hydrolase-1 domain-containing protein n=1 Tax=Amborella trichopoda TaxID=13333 RepID=W1NMA0_AMBTC|nr:hypothetical protein AMTR_s00001p00272340 [Amborella trichopoda]
MVFGGDMKSPTVHKFSYTLFNMRQDIALSVFQTFVQRNLRGVLGRVTMLCHILQSTKDLAVPVVVSEYIHQHLDGESIVEVKPSKGHLLLLSSPYIIIPVLLCHIRK